MCIYMTEMYSIAGIWQIVCDYLSLYMDEFIHLPKFYLPNAHKMFTKLFPHQTFPAIQ